MENLLSKCRLKCSFYFSYIVLNARGVAGKSTISVVLKEDSAELKEV
jgi:hypothetical protein